jgi:hypothetical protein
LFIPLPTSARTNRRTPAEELLARLTKGRGKSGMSMSGMGMGGMAEMMTGMSHDELMKGHNGPA